MMRPRLLVSAMLINQQGVMEDVQEMVTAWKLARVWAKSVGPVERDNNAVQMGFMSKAITRRREYSTAEITNGRPVFVGSGDGKAAILAVPTLELFLKQMGGNWIGSDRDSRDYGALQVLV